jgi:Domain of unknown function (DUF4070)
VEGINFIPKGEMTKREVLEKYRELVQEIYRPEAYFARTLPAMLELRVGASLAARRHGVKLVTVLLKEFYHFGLRARAIRVYFWKAFFRILSKRPAALEPFIFDCAVFHHLHQHADYVQREIGRYLAAPNSDDVLDEVINPDSAVAAEAMSEKQTFLAKVVSA